MSDKAHHYKGCYEKTFFRNIMAPLSTAKYKDDCFLMLVTFLDAGFETREHLYKWHLDKFFFLDLILQNYMYLFGKEYVAGIDISVAYWKTSVLQSLHDLWFNVSLIENYLTISYY